MVKYLQQNPRADKMKMAFVSDQLIWVQPQCYFGILQAHVKSLKGDTQNAKAMIDNWSKIEQSKISKLDPNANKLTLENGKEFSYKALVIGTGFDHSMNHIEGLAEYDSGPETNHVFVHQIDNKERLSRNYHNGNHHQGGNHICYSPAVPYKGEGTDFYALYYEWLNRQDRLLNSSSQGGKIEVWTPNKFIYAFPYANEVAMEECEKRGIEVNLGWELLKVHNDGTTDVATFKNVDTGATIEHDFTAANINPPSKQHQFILDSGVCDKDGMVDVNRYTLQHNKFENIFAIGDCISGQTTRTYTGGMHQHPVVKHNMLSFLEGKDTNAIYDGYQYMPMWMGNAYGAGFSHLHDFEPANTNDSMPHYGVFSNLYFNYFLNNQVGMGQKYTSFKKNHGPPHYHYEARFDALEHNEYLAARQIDESEVLHVNAQRRQAQISGV